MYTGKVGYKLPRSRTSLLVFLIKGVVYFSHTVLLLVLDQYDKLFIFMLKKDSPALSLFSDFQLPWVRTLVLITIRYYLASSFCLAIYKAFSLLPSTSLSISLLDNSLPWAFLYFRLPFSL